MTRHNRIYRTSLWSGLLAVLAVGFSLVSCGGGTGPGDDGNGASLSLSISPDGLTLFVGGEGTLTATVRDSAGTTVSGNGVVWSSLASPVASVSAAGVVNGVSVGLTSVIASLGDQADTVAIAVIDGTSDSLTIEILPPSASVAVAGTATFTAVVRNKSGAVVATPPLLWASSNTAIGMVVGGVAVGVAPGTASITASLGSIISAPAVLTVTGTLRPCDNVAMVPFWDVLLSVRYTMVITNADNEHVVVDQSATVTATMQALGGILPAFSWEGSLSGTVAQNDKLTHLDQMPPSTETIIGEGIPVIGSGRSVFRLNIDEDDCTFTFSANPFIHVTHTDPNALPPTETADLGLGVVLAKGPLEEWRFFNGMFHPLEEFPAHFVVSSAAGAGLNVYVPLGFGLRLWSSNNLESAMGTATVGYSIHPHP